MRPVRNASRRPRLLTWRVAGVLAILAVALAGCFAALVWWVNGHVAPGTTVAGVSVGGLHPDEARDAIGQWARAQEGSPIIVQAPDTLSALLPKTSGLRIDVDATVSGLPDGGWHPRILVSWLTGGPPLAAIVKVDDAALDAALGRLTESLSRSLREPILRFDGVRPVLTPGQPGRRLDAARLRREIVDSFPSVSGPIAATFSALAPSVAEEQARQARDSAQDFINRRISITSGDARARLSRRLMARSITFRPQEGTLVPVVDGTILRDRLVRRFPGFQTAGRDASFRIRNGTPVVRPSRPGSTIDADDVAAAVTSAVVSLPAAGTVSVPQVPMEADLTEAEARDLRITDRLSKFTQAFAYAPYRVQNIGQAAQYIDGTILMPGDVFSLNDVIMERTRENGYTEGTVIGPGGVFREDLGGGVSASATATWTAAFFAGMERTDTRAHSIYISRYQPGLEATVAWGVFDMRFRNDSPDAVLIKARTTNTSMTVSFWGTRRYDEITADFGPRTDIVRYETIYDDAPACRGQQGIDGFHIDVDRVFTRAGVEVKRETISTTYKPAPRVICRDR